MLIYYKSNILRIINVIYDECACMNISLSSMSGKYHLTFPYFIHCMGSSSKCMHVAELCYFNTQSDNSAMT